ncbi:MAG: flagellar basal body L-ring protein FlgH [Proteobacteria bacterium]|nr:flagellar basal body L-ring protein FlgH [Pseudomonadota bacterium]
MSKRRFKKDLFTGVMLAGLVCGLTACNTLDRFDELGGTPALSAVSTPQAIPVSFPVPATETHERQPNSLWQAGARAFFKDQRASKVGDILTVIVQVSDKADIKNETTRTRGTTEQDGVSNLGGLEGELHKFLPNPGMVDPSKLIDMNGTTSNEGKGKINRQDQVNMRIAAVVTQVLPNGNLVIYGKQEMVVNYDLRELKVAGVIRPEDISAQNSISYDQIAEARLNYGGRGQIMDVQQPRYGSQALDILYPF